MTQGGDIKSDPRRLAEQRAAEFRAAISRLLPFADAASDALPLSRLIRLSLFQVSVGMAVALTTGAINRVLIVELGAPAALVALMVSLPLIVAPFRAMIGHRSDTHRSIFGWRRVPFIWFGTVLQFAGLSIMPFALLVLTSPTAMTLQFGGVSLTPDIVGAAAASLAFLLVGAGAHTTQTTGLALAADLAPASARPRVVALLYVALLVGVAASAAAFGALLQDFTPAKLIQTIQGAAVLTFVLNVVAMWKQETRSASTSDAPAGPSFGEAWRGFVSRPRARRTLIAVGLGSAAFSMQDILLEPYGGEILSLTVSQTTLLTTIFALGTLAGFALAARLLTRGVEPHGLAGGGLFAGVWGFAAVVLADPLHSALLFRIGVAIIGFGGGLFSVCTLTALMALARPSAAGAERKDALAAQSGIALGAWGAVQATSAGLAMAFGGAVRDGVGGLAAHGDLGPALSTPAAGYIVVYHLEILLLFAALAAIGPLVRRRYTEDEPSETEKFGLAAFPS